MHIYVFRMIWRNWRNNPDYTVFARRHMRRKFRGRMLWFPDPECNGTGPNGHIESLTAEEVGQLLGGN